MNVRHVCMRCMMPLEQDEYFAALKHGKLGWEKFKYTKFTTFKLRSLELCQSCSQQMSRVMREHPHAQKEEMTAWVFFTNRDGTPIM